MRSNPFFELYVGDRISSEEFVTVFSPFLIDHAQALFLPGNVVVTGIQGSGKSMLLTLQKPGVRLQYKNAGREFPVPSKLRKFIGAGINLTHSNAIDFGNRRISDDPMEVAILFGDFVNYTIALDLINSLQMISDSSSAVAKDIGIRLSERDKQELAKTLRKDDSWFGYFESCQTLPAVLAQMKRRLSSYRAYLHMNDKTFDEAIRKTKTAIGVPISSLVDALKHIEAIKEDVNVFVHIDQYEELANLSSNESGGADYRAVINRALSRRDPAISYRIGSRGHAWRDHGLILGSSAKLEEERDYKFVNLDEKLRRPENRKTWIFPDFAADVFARRLNHSGLSITIGAERQLMGQVFGKGLSPESKALKYAGKNPRRAVKVDNTWPGPLKEFLLRLADTDPLSARLGEAWVLQKRSKKLAQGLKPDNVPWKREYWRKERIELALIQIASRCQQRPYWCGQDDVVDLSGGNILTFLSLCQFIWDAQIQIGKQGPHNQPPLVEIEPEIQAIGIFKASDHWLKKISQETGRSGDRLRFIRQLGETLSRGLMADRKLSYPGHNGFSVADDDLDAHPDLKRFLHELSDYGNLLQVRHTTKERDRKTRYKWYPTPILCPHFKLPFKRLKEPKYVRASELYAWLSGAKSPKGSNLPEDQLPLFTSLTE